MLCSMLSGLFLLVKNVDNHWTSLYPQGSFTSNSFAHQIIGEGEYNLKESDIDTCLEAFVNFS